MSAIGGRIDDELLSNEYIQISALLNPARGCRVVKRSADGEEILNYFMPNYETTLPMLQTVYINYKNSVPNSPKPMDPVNAAASDSPNIIEVPRSAISVLLQSNATNASVAMFSTALKCNCLFIYYLLILKF